MLTIAYYTLPKKGGSQGQLLIRRLRFSYYGREKVLEEGCTPEFAWQQQEPDLNIADLQEISVEEARQLSESWHRDQRVSQSDEPLATIARIKAKLGMLGRIDVEYRMHGSRKHRYRLLPPLPSARISELEKRYHLTLPQDYRLFLQEVGSGGAGPDYGLDNFEVVLQRTEAFELKERPDYFRRPFVPPASVEEFYANEDSFCALLALGSQGCSYITYLVISGRERGTIWEECENGIVPLGPHPSPTLSAFLRDHEMYYYVDYFLSPAYSHHYTFLEWYENWLDGGLRSLQKVE